MSQPPVSQWSVFCIHEQIPITVWSPTLPTLCPNDHPNRQIDPIRTFYLGTHSNQNVNIIDPTPGYYQQTTLQFTTTTNSTGTYDFSWPFSIHIGLCTFMPNDEHIGDSFDVLFAPNLQVGYLTAKPVPVTIGSTYDGAQIQGTALTISSTAFAVEYLRNGVDVTLRAGAQYYAVGRITGVDAQNFRINIEDTQQTAANIYATNESPIIVCLSIYSIKNLLVTTSTRIYSMNSKGFSNIRVPPNTTLRFVYRNSKRVAKRCSFNIEYMYS